MNAKQYTRNQVKWLKSWAKSKFDATKDAVDVVAIASKENNEKQNEWRGQLKDQAGTFATKDVVDALRDSMLRLSEQNSHKIAELQTFNANLIGKITIGGVIWTVLIITITYLLNKK